MQCYKWNSWIPLFISLSLSPSLSSSFCHPLSDIKNPNPPSQRSNSMPSQTLPTIPKNRSKPHHPSHAPKLPPKPKQILPPARRCRSTRARATVPKIPAAAAAAPSSSRRASCTGVPKRNHYCAGGVLVLANRYTHGPNANGRRYSKQTTSGDTLVSFCCLVARRSGSDACWVRLRARVICWGRARAHARTRRGRCCAVSFSGGLSGRRSTRVRCLTLGLCVLSNVQPLCASISPSTKKRYMNIYIYLYI